jgi:hypothetical protein
VTKELDVLTEVAARLEAAQVPYMLTGSLAMAFYTKPRTTRNVDVVVALTAKEVAALAAGFSKDFQIDIDVVRSAAKAEGFFNAVHLASGIKVNFIVRKSAEYRVIEFERRRRVVYSGVDCWIVSREDLILSKLVWARETGSTLQDSDIRALIDKSVDWKYLRRWAVELRVADALEDLKPGA